MKIRTSSGTIYVFEVKEDGIYVSRTSSYNLAFDRLNDSKNLQFKLRGPLPKIRIGEDLILRTENHGTIITTSVSEVFA